MKHFTLVALATLLGTMVHAQDNHLDPTFGDNGRVAIDPLGGGAFFHALAVQPDGRIVCAGTAQDADEHQQALICRFLADGQLDLDFSGDGFLTFDPLGFGASISAMVLLPNGDIQVAGGVENSNGHLRLMSARIHPDGTFDEAFGTDGVFRLSIIRTNAGCMELLDDGSVLIGGSHDVTIQYPYYDGDVIIVKLDPTGALDASFGQAGITEFVASPMSFSTGISIEAMSDGSFFVAGYEATCEFRSLLIRLLADGTVDPDFNNGVGVFYVAGSPDGCDIGWMTDVLMKDPTHAVVIQFIDDLDFITGRIVRNFDITGAIDPDYGENGFIGNSTFPGTAHLIDGELTTIDLISFLGDPVEHGLVISRYDANGTSDASFMENGVLQTTNLDIELYGWVSAMTTHWRIFNGSMDMDVTDERIYFCAGTHSDTKAALWAFSEQITTGVVTTEQTAAPLVAPVPANDQVIISLPNAFTSTMLELIDTHGRVVHTSTIGSGTSKVTIDVSDMSAGAYTIRIPGSTPARFVVMH